MFARKDKFGAGSCNEEDNDVQFTSCSKPTIQLYPLITSFDRFRIKPTLQYFFISNKLIFGLSAGLIFQLTTN